MHLLVLIFCVKHMHARAVERRLELRKLKRKLFNGKHYKNRIVLRIQFFRWRSILVQLVAHISFLKRVKCQKHVISVVVNWFGRNFCKKDRCQRWKRLCSQVVLVSRQKRETSEMFSAHFRPEYGVAWYVLAGLVVIIYYYLNC